MFLAGDIGGTKTDLAVFDRARGPFSPVVEKRYPSGDYESLEAIVREFLDGFDLPIQHASFAVAGPVSEGSASLTNLPWVIDQASLASTLPIGSVTLLNDVAAMAAAIPYLRAGDVRTLREGKSAPGGTIALLAAGTGLGQAFLTWNGDRYRAHSSEGGHVDFGPTTDLETRLLTRLRARFGRVSYERVCAGRSMPDLYDFLADESGIPESEEVRAELAIARDRTPAILQRAVDRERPDPLCSATVDLFSSVLGAQAGNFALTVLATGGVYIAGGIPQRILPVVTGQGRLMVAAFEQKGRLSPLLGSVPIHVIVDPVALLGAAVESLDSDVAERTAQG